MNTHLSKTSNVLYALLITNINRLNHYQMVMDKSNDIELKLIFLNCAVQSQSFCTTLSKWLGHYQPTTSIQVKKNFMVGILLKLKALLLSAGRNSLLHRSEDLEQITLQKYRSALSVTYLPLALIKDLSKQAKELEETVHSLKEMHQVAADKLQAA
jgi:hypothetical protein